VLVPDLAIIDTGARKIAFVSKGGGRFEPREVVVGASGGDNMLQVLSGLAPGEQVVISGQFLLDSESRLREAALKMMEPGKAMKGAKPAEQATAEAAKENTKIVTSGASLDHEELYYACPMPEHADILYQAPGNCPICGMKMVPVHHRPGQPHVPAPIYWTCPMPGHESVREKGPGKCPICGMTLIPVVEDDAGVPAADGNVHEHN